MKPQFTPGPWLIDGGNFVYALNEHETNRFSAQVAGGYKSASRTENDEIEANAHLIAAAPELYEALELAAEIISNQFRDGFAHNDDDPDFPGLPSYYIGPGVLPKLSAALAKARGEAA